MKSKLSSKEIDKLEAQTLVLPFFSDEKPLKGANGLIDWRMNGSISRLIMEGKITGKRGESVLILPRKRIKGEKILMIGLGESKEFNGHLLEGVSGEILRQVVKIGVNQFTVAIPSKRHASITTAVASTSIIQGMVDAAKQDKVNDDRIFVTLAVDKESMDEAKTATDKLSKAMKEKK